MRRPRRLVALLAVGLMAGPVAAQAALVTIQISGTLTYVSSALSSAVSTGDPFSVSLTYDSNLAPSPTYNTGVEAGYLFPTGAYAMTVNVDGYAGSSSAGRITVINDWGANGDWFQATASTTTGFSGDPIASLIWRHTTLTLKDLESGIFSNTSIPSSMTAGPFDIVLLHMYFYDTSGNLAGSMSSDNGTLAISSVPIPAAAWLLLSGLGGLGFIGRRRRAA